MIYKFQLGVNTIIECLARNTPIIVNKCPPAVELLGETYPLYLCSDNTDYISLNLEINNLLNDPDIIRKTYDYLTEINKNNENNIITKAADASTKLI